MVLPRFRRSQDIFWLYALCAIHVQRMGWFENRQDIQNLLQNLEKK